MTQSLPANPSLEHLKKQAKSLLKHCNEGDADASNRVAAGHPKAIDLGQLKLADCQLVLAREYGFKEWSKLKKEVERANNDLAARFIKAAVLTYGGSLEADIALAKSDSRRNAARYRSEYMGGGDSGRRRCGETLSRRGSKAGEQKGRSS